MPEELARHPLAIAMRLLQTLGRPGEYVWKNGKRIENLEERLAYLTSAIEWLREKAKEPIWRELPVDFRTFVECEDLLDKHGELYPAVMEACQEINSGRYVECVLTGGIGVGKSHSAIYTQAYQVYIMACLADPHALFELDPASSIVVIFQSINKHLALDVDFSAFREIILGSPYFRTRYPVNRDLSSRLEFPRRLTVKPVAGGDKAAIGQNVIGGILDEVNFMAVVENSKHTKDGSIYDQAKQNYNSIARRRQSRFMNQGILPGMLCLVSSRNYPGQLTDQKELEAKTNPRIYIYDKKVWEIKPWAFGAERFRVFIGDVTRQPRILQDDEFVSDLDDHLVLEVPTEYRYQFEEDILASLRDIAGVATQAIHPFIPNQEAVAKCFGVVKSVLSDTWCDFRDHKVLMFPKRIIEPDEPRYAHIDLSTSRDSTGVAIGWVEKFVEVNRRDMTEMLPQIRYDAILEVRPPRGGEILIENIRGMLYKLRDDLGMNIKWVSFDQYQSTDGMQALYQKGFQVGRVSMDVTTDPYQCLKQALYDGRILAPTHDKALHELVTLELDTKKDKIDHPATSSKDVSDAVAGVAWGLTMRREIWFRHGVGYRYVPLVGRTSGAEQKDTFETHGRRIEASSGSYAENLRAAREAERYAAELEDVG